MRILSGESVETPWPVGYFTIRYGNNHMVISQQQQGLQTLLRNTHILSGERVAEPIRQEAHARRHKITRLYDYLRVLVVYSRMAPMSSPSSRECLSLRLFNGRGPRFSTPTRLQLVGPLPLAAAAPPAAICLCTVLRCLAQVRVMPPVAGEVELGEGVEEGAGEGEECGM